MTAYLASVYFDIENTSKPANIVFSLISTMRTSLWHHRKTFSGMNISILAFSYPKKYSSKG